MNNTQEGYLTKFIQLTVRTIYRFRIDIGQIRWVLIAANFIYITSLLYPITKFKPQYDGSQIISQDSPSSSIINNINENITNQIGWREGYKFFFLGVRPTQILNFNNNNELNLFFAVFLMSILLILFGIIIYTVIFTPCNNYSSYLLMKYILLFANTFNYFFMMLIVEILSTIGFHGGFGFDIDKSFANNTTKEIVARVICIILLPFTYLFSLFSLIFGEQCITHEELGLFRNNSNTLIIILITTIKFALAIIIGVDPNYQQESTFLLIWLVTLSYIILVIYEFYHDIPFSSFKVQNVYYAFVNQSFIMIIQSLFRNDKKLVASTNFNPDLLKPEKFILILLIVSVVFQYCSFQIWYRLRDHIMYSNYSSENLYKKSNHRYISRRINMLIMNQRLSVTKYPVQYIGVFNSHQKYCLDKYCFCHAQQMMKGEQNQVLLLNNRVYEQLIRMYIRNDLSLIDVFHNLEDSFQFLRYMDHFLYVKKHTFALYKIIDIQIESEKMKKTLNIKTSLSLQVMLEILKETMSNDIRKGIVDLTVEQTSKAIEIYIQMESLKAILKQMIYKCLEMKKDTLDLMKKSFEFSQEVEDLNCQYNSQLDITETMLLDFYNRFTTPLNQLILVFFESEIKGNLKKAHYVKQAHKQSEIAEYLNSKNMFIEVFSQDVISITATVGKKLGRIVGYSDKTPMVFGYKKQEFDYISDIKDLMPITLAKVHDEVVRFMMIRGKYNVVHIARTVFLRNKNNFIFQVNIFADINFFYSEELPFIFMVKVVRSNSGFLIVNKKGRVEGICQNFFALINQPIESLPFMFKVDIQYLIPSFEQLIIDIKPFQKLEENNVDLTFPETKGQLFYDLFYSKQLKQYNIFSLSLLILLLKQISNLKFYIIYFHQIQSLMIVVYIYFQIFVIII